MASPPFAQGGADPAALVDQLNSWGARAESALAENRTAVENLQDSQTDIVTQPKAALT